MYYKQIDNQFINANSEILQLRKRYSQLTDEILNQHDIFLYVAPDKTDTQTNDQLIKVDNIVTHSLRDKTQEELDRDLLLTKFETYNWYSESGDVSNCTIRITCDYSLVERDIYGNPAPLTSFADNLIKRKAKYDYNSDIRTFTVYLKYFNADEKYALEHHPNHDDWIADGTLKVEDINLLQ